MFDRSRGIKVHRLVLAIWLWTGGLGMASAQTLEVIPKQVLVDESAVIRAKGLTPNEHISIQADSVDGADKDWSSQAEFIADAQGTVDTSQQAPVEGSYKEVSAMGLIWSMKPGAKHVESYQAPRDLGTQIINFRLLRNGQPVTTALMEQLGVAAGVQQIKVEGQLHGVLSTCLSQKGAVGGRRKWLSDIVVALVYIGVAGFILDRLVAALGAAVTRSSTPA